MKLASESKLFLSKLREELEKAGANPVLLRNYDDLPDEIGNDLDLYVSRDKLPVAESILLRCARHTGGTIAHIHRRDYFVAYWLKFGNEERFWHVDLYPGALTWHGYPYLDTGRFLGKSRRIGDWSVPGKAHEALITVLTSLLWGGFFKERYWKHLRNLLSDEEEETEFRSCLESVFGQSAEGCLRATTGEGITQNETQVIAKEMRRSLRAGCFKKAPGKTIVSLSKHWIGEAKCYALDPPGIAITAPPGKFPTDLGDGKCIYQETGNFFGGFLDLRATSLNGEKRIRNRIREIKARGANFIVIHTGDQEGIIGETASLQGKAASLMEVVTEHLSKRIPATNR